MRITCSASTWAFMPVAEHIDMEKMTIRRIADGKNLKKQDCLTGFGCFGTRFVAEIICLRLYDTKIRKMFHNTFVGKGNFVNHVAWQSVLILHDISLSGLHLEPDNI